MNARSKVLGYELAAVRVPASEAWRLTVRGFDRNDVEDAQPEPVLWERGGLARRGQRGAALQLSEADVHVAVGDDDLIRMPNQVRATVAQT